MRKLLKIPTSKFQGHLVNGNLKDNLSLLIQWTFQNRTLNIIETSEFKVRIVKAFPKSNLGNAEKLEPGGTLGNVNVGGTLVNLIGGRVGAHPGEPLGPKNRAVPLDIE